jgi:hypothetical protein
MYSGAVRKHDVRLVNVNCILYFCVQRREVDAARGGANAFFLFPLFSSPAALSSGLHAFSFFQ